jgi:hypothetical protein
MTTAQKYALLLTRFAQLEKTFEELLADRIALAELRDWYRNRAGLETKIQDDAEK